MDAGGCGAEVRCYSTEVAGARPLLLFDSGVGGLSVAGAIRALLPQAPLVYVADHAAYPYGTKPAAVIEARVPALLGRLAERFDPALIVIACNTASTIALDAVRSALDLPIVGTVPAIKPAASLSRTRAIGVLGTEATVRQPYVDRLAAAFAAECTMLRHGSAELVDLAEAKLRGEPGNMAAYRRVLAGLLDQPGGKRIDTVVLACTHFPLVEAELAAAAPRPLTFVDGKEGIARRVAWLTRERAWPQSPPEHRALFTGAGAGIDAYRPGFAAFGFAEVRTV
ncbi:MAG: glutamate racemase [Alphaproteobacteria bacterium]|nr:glutamate racemase [Alphaproteobacteria bacterium]